MVLGLELRDLDIGHTRVIKFTAEPSKTHMHMHAYARAHTLPTSSVYDSWRMSSICCIQTRYQD